MKELKKLLERWERIVPVEQEVRAVLPAILKKEARVDISPKNISIRNNTVFIHTSSLAKVEIFLKKTKILSELLQVLGKKTPKDIR